MPVLDDASGTQAVAFKDGAMSSALLLRSLWQWHRPGLSHWHLSHFSATGPGQVGSPAKLACQ